MAALGRHFKGRDMPAVPRGYMAGLDGVRALSLLVMLAYHHGFEWAKGGFFGVSTFFTLSGFLITSLALAEWADRGSLSLAGFWERRARRLLPAALLTIAGVVALQHFFEIGSSTRFRGDLLSTVGYYANWRLASNGNDYGDLFSSASPVQHFWSLAIEEQFYLLFPLLFVGLMRLMHHRWRRTGLCFGLLGLAAFTAAWLTASPSGADNGGLTYYATWTRAGEILVGVALAFVVPTRRAQRALNSQFGAWAMRAAGIIGSAALIVIWSTVELESPAVFHGMTALNALASSAIILMCASQTPGLLAVVLASWPLRNLGKISYAVYLFHWPLFMYFNEPRYSLGVWPSFGLRVGVSIALATASYHLLETPIRFRWMETRRHLAGSLAVPAIATVVLVTAVPVHSPNMPDLNLGDSSMSSAGSNAGPELNQPIVPTGEPVVRALLVGDSVAWTMIPGLTSWNENNPYELVQVDTHTAMGCQLSTPGPTQFLGQDTKPWPDCVNFRQELMRKLAETDIDVIVVVHGHKDLGEREINGEVTHLGEPAYNDFFAQEAASFAEIVASEQVPVLWAKLPHLRVVPQDSTQRWTEFGENHPERIDSLNGIVADTIKGLDNFELLDLAGWMEDQDDGEFDRDIRADLMHFSFEGSDQVGEWLVPQIIEAGTNK